MTSPASPIGRPASTSGRAFPFLLISRPAQLAGRRIRRHPSTFVTSDGGLGNVGHSPRAPPAVDSTLFPASSPSASTRSSYRANASTHCNLQSRDYTVSRNLTPIPSGDKCRRHQTRPKHNCSRVYIMLKPLAQIRGGGVREFESPPNLYQR